MGRDFLSIGQPAPYEDIELRPQSSSEVAQPQNQGIFFNHARMQVEESSLHS
jgi:hypothetical protein